MEMMGQRNKVPVRDVLSGAWNPSADSEPIEKGSAHLFRRKVADLTGDQIQMAPGETSFFGADIDADQIHNGAGCADDGKIQMTAVSVALTIQRRSLCLCAHTIFCMLVLSGQVTATVVPRSVVVSVYHCIPGLSARLEF